MYQVHNVSVKSAGVIVDVIHGNPRHCRTVHTEDDLPGLSVDAVLFPGKRCMQLLSVQLKLAFIAFSEA